MENITQGQWFRGPSADLGETIDQSLRFSGSKLTGSTVSTSTWTCSFWIKFAVGDGSGYIFSAGNDAGVSTNGNQLYMNNDADSVRGRLSFDNGIEMATRRLRDPSAWYHIVGNYNGSVLNYWVNNESLDTLSGVAGTGHSGTFVIGGTPNTSDASCWDAIYLAEFNYLDGTVLTPTSFGRTNDDGVWVPEDLSSLTSDQYGADGFRLVFDSSADGGIGDDSAPTGGTHASANDFTASGFQTTSTHENYDLDYNDTPTSNYCTLNSLRSAATVGRGTQDANLTIDGTSDEQWQATQGTCAQNSGVRFFEMEISSSGSGANNNFVGFASADCRFEINALQDNTTERAKGMMLFCDDGKTQLDANARATYSSNMAAGEVIGCQIDFDAEEVEFFRDGTSLGAVDVSSSPLVDGRMVVPVNIVIGGSTNSHDMYLNYGQRAFQHAPTGVTAADNGFETNNLPEPTIKNGKEHFEAVTYTGNGSTQSITSLEFQPDFVWLKSRNVGYHNRLFDVIRGQSSLVSDDARAEGTSADSSLTSFDSNGFSITQTTNESYNQSTKTYVAWCWKAGGTAVSNTDGDITSSVSANTDAGFSIVKYTGSTGDDSVGHGLTQAPEVIFVKSLDDATRWVTFHEPLGSNSFLSLNNTDTVTTAANYWGQGMTATTFGVQSGGSANNNNNGSDTIAYCWHSVEGFSKFGSYTGNGNADGPFIYLGFKPAWIMVKRATGGTANWQIMDTTRSPSNPADKWIEANEATQEQTGNSFIKEDFLSNGFKPRGGASSQDNISGSTYVYMAFAENPFGGENTPPATAR